MDLGIPRPWLPAGWGQGMKTTCVAKLQCYVSPEGKLYYHRHDVERVTGGRATDDTGARQWTARWAAERAAQRQAREDENNDEAKKWATSQIQAGRLFSGKAPVFVTDSKLFAHLTKEEREHLLNSDEFHFAVVSARRAEAKGLRAVANVQAQFVKVDVQPTWYVDGPSLESYKNLGLDAKAGGKLVPARNLALDDAAKLGKVCVQISDDIASWDYYCGKLERLELSAANQAAKTGRLRVSPVSAARFLLAKMRAARGSGDGPRLAGVFPLGNTGMAFSGDAVSKDKFILGDFFVADNSTCRFDERMSLKEDYDYTCSHLAAHGEVLRCNRMFIAAAHETNAGGAVSERDEKGDKERDNIQVLREKWPGVFHINGKRGDTQVVMSWRRRRMSAA